MQISSSLGTSIVTEVKKIIHEDLTFMDKSCRIIACTDEKRIGDFHEASRKMLDEGLKELTVPDDDTYQGTRSGINLTLEIEGQVVGVVGHHGKRRRGQPLRTGCKENDGNPAAGKLFERRKNADSQRQKPLFAGMADDG